MVTRRKCLEMECDRQRFGDDPAWSDQVLSHYHLGQSRLSSTTSHLWTHGEQRTILRKAEHQRITLKKPSAHPKGCSQGLEWVRLTCLYLSDWFQNGQGQVLSLTNLLDPHMMNKIYIKMPHFNRVRHIGAGFWVF